MGRGKGKKGKGREGGGREGKGKGRSGGEGGERGESGVPNLRRLATPLRNRPEVLMAGV